MVEKVVVISEQQDRMGQPLEENGISVYPIQPDRMLNIGLRYLIVFISTLCALIKTNPDVLYADGEYGFLAVFLGRITFTPVFIRIPGNILTECRESHLEYRSKGKILTAMLFYSGYLLHHLVRYADGLITVSEDLREKMIDGLNVSPNKVSSIPVPLVFEVPDRSDSEIPLTILTVTDIKFEGKRKGLKDSIRVAHNLLKENSHLEYRLAFDGSRKKEIEEFINMIVSDKRVRSRINCLGYVDDVSEEYAQADIFLYISYLDGYPSVILEAQSAGLPIVANADFGIIEQIIDGETGFLVENEYVHQKAVEAIQRLVDDADLRDEIGESASKHVTSNNSHARIGKQLINEFDT